ncbi:hypothetical protein GKZ90_0009085 [Flavobacterium sp. MC2016-06]|jgi:hypothetical protein|uniref:hypothetical protein n=1 Tax=Flavobacterium sp. MC2016-06 TaxID=2676308 RepID=UPI0012BA9A14|nr:hypothetical protein [Flavobacterium sp. MC2016-06]MBU3859382.1 hypothetical protein [Flavobacterium sp. MC2016-06]
MKKSILIIIFVFLFIKISNAQEKNNIDQVFKLKIENRIISKGDNFPEFNIEKDNRDRLLFALHNNFTIKDFQNSTQFDDDKILKMIYLLESKNWLSKINSKYKPTIFIADAKDGKLLYKYASPISKEITKSIFKNLANIKADFQKTEISKTTSFESYSFLILSNVLLDSWQINNVEKGFLKKDDRPFRHGKNYYAAIFENTNSKIESFGIYGNQSHEIENNKSMCVYGNNRNEFEAETSRNFISKPDNEIFAKIAESYLPELLKILEKNRKYSYKIYSKLGYSEEITFEEFFIWWYHFIYTQSTNEMNSKGILKIPENGNFDYILNE